MYAAAGGASLASRQKRKNQAAQNVKNKALLQQGLKEKLAASRASGLATPTKATSRPFHNLPANYLRTPQAVGPTARKLSSGGYTAQSRLLLPINEAATATSSSVTGDTQHYNYNIHQQQNQQLHHPTQQQQLLQQQLFAQQSQLQQLKQQQHQHHTPHSHSHSPHPHHHHHHHHHQQHHHHSHFHHSHSHSQHRTQAGLVKSQLLPKSATLPIVSRSDATPPATPPTTTTTSNEEQPPVSSTLLIAVHDTIVVTPASPSSSNAAADDAPAPAPAVLPPPPAQPLPLERKCSFFRGQRKLLADGEPDAQLDNPRPTTLACCQYDVCDDAQCQLATPFYSDSEYREAYAAGQAITSCWQPADPTDPAADFCDCEHRQLGICTCDHVEVTHPKC